MALEAVASKRGMTLPTAYIVITNVKMEKYLRPTLDDNKIFAGNVSAVQYSARAEIYSSKEERDEDFGGTPFSSFFAFGHAPGMDLTEEAYAFIVAHGIVGWTLADIKHV